MGTYLTNDQIAKAKEELRIVYAMPYSSTLVGPAWEQILAEIKGGSQKGAGVAGSERWSRDNRAKPDIVVREGDNDVNYSVKTEGLRTTRERQHAGDFLGYHEDIIVARPKVDDLFAGRALDSVGADDLGELVLRYYNEQIVVRYKWHVISFLLRLDAAAPYEFIYWEERPPTAYNPDDFWWRDSGRATGGNRNINGYPKTVSRDMDPKHLPRAKFKFTSGGKQFYVLYDIPTNADVWALEEATLSMHEVRDALRELLRREQRMDDQEPAT